jgi:hypothetical protein
MAQQKTLSCECNGHSHCPKCSGSGKPDIHIVIHPRCNYQGCKGTMFPIDCEPGSRLKCNKCKRIF